MACRDAYKNRENIINTEIKVKETVKTEVAEIVPAEKLLFGVDSEIQSNDVLQNNLTEFDWATRNKLYPNFWGRNLLGENCLTKAEIDFLHDKGCRIAAIYNTDEAKETEDQGRIHAKKIDIIALELGIRDGTAIFVEIKENENVTKEYMHGLAQELLLAGYVPAFKVNTDAKYGFDREYSRGMQTDMEVFSRCLIWAVSPSLEEYEEITSSHLIHPDNWMPFAPSGITRNEIAIWQYGKNCHPINDDTGKKTTFNINLVRNEQVIIERMF